MACPRAPHRTFIALPAAVAAIAAVVAVVVTAAAPAVANPPGWMSYVSHTTADPTTTANDASSGPILSGDGRFVAFTSAATDLVTGQADTNAANDVFLWDGTTNASILVSHVPAGTATTSTTGRSFLVAMTPDASWVVFWSAATDLVPGQVDTNGGIDVFLWERATGAISLVSHVPGSTVTTGNDVAVVTRYKAISDDGAYVAFVSNATNLVPGQADANAGADTFLYTRATGT